MKQNLEYNIYRLATFFALMGLATLFFGCNHAHAQTNSSTPPATFASAGITLPPQLSDPSISGGLQQIYDAALGSTNFAVAVGGGRSTKGNNNLGFADYIYNFNQNVGAVLGYDYLWSSTKGIPSNLNFVKGGLNVKAEIAPLKSIAPNFKVTPFSVILIDTSAGQVGQIVVAGADYHIGIAKGWMFNVGGFYENRTGGNTAYDGAYICGHIAISKGF